MSHVGVVRPPPQAARPPHHNSPTRKYASSPATGLFLYWRPRLPCLRCSVDPTESVPTCLCYLHAHELCHESCRRCASTHCARACVHRVLVRRALHGAGLPKARVDLIFAKTLRLGKQHGHHQAWATSGNMLGFGGFVAALRVTAVELFFSADQVGCAHALQDHSLLPPPPPLDYLLLRCPLASPCGTPPRWPAERKCTPTTGMTGADTVARCDRFSAEEAGGRPHLAGDCGALCRWHVPRVGGGTGIAQ